jgi:hypothetical protein
MTIDDQVKAADAKIAELESALIVAQEHRRELVNRGNLNKCVLGHYWTTEGPFNVVCRKCGKRYSV